MEDGCPPQGLTDATPSAQLCDQYPDETRRGDLSTQASRTACAVLTTPCSAGALKIPRLYGGRLGTRLKWTGQGPSAPSHVNSGSASMTSPGECASRPGPAEGDPARLETRWDPSSQRK